MSRLRQYNLKDLTKRYRDNSSAQWAAKMLRKHSWQRESEKQYIVIRDYHQFPIENSSQINLKSAFDALVNFYGILEIAALIDFLPEPLPHQFRVACVRDLRNDSFRHYSGTARRCLLPELARARIFAAWNGKEQAAPALIPLFYRFLDLNFRIERNHNAQLFLWLAHGGEIEDQSFRDLLFLLKNPQSCFERLEIEPGLRSPLDGAIHGMFTFFTFCVELNALLLESAEFPLLQSACWHYHGSLFRGASGKFAHNLMKGLQVVSAWRGTYTFTRLEGPFVSVTRSLEDLFSEKYRLALLSQIDPQQKSFVMGFYEEVSPGAVGLVPLSAMDLVAKPVTELGLSTRASCYLDRSGIVTISQLVAFTESQLLSLGFGRNAVQEIKESLNAAGLFLGMRIKPDQATSPITEPLEYGIKSDEEKQRTEAGEPEGTSYA